MTRFRINWAKVVEAIDFVATLKPGVTQYYIGKILFFADREHLLDYGRPITGDRYVAMEHGPVPSAIRDILKADSDGPDDLLAHLHNRVVIDHDENRQKIFT
ncbi:MAG: Panacea domain-containing protein, partial [Hyphomicrobium sp.]